MPAIQNRQRQPDCHAWHYLLYDLFGLFGAFCIFGVFIWSKTYLNILIICRAPFSQSISPRSPFWTRFTSFLLKKSHVFVCFLTNILTFELDIALTSLQKIWDPSRLLRNALVYRNSCTPIHLNSSESSYATYRRKTCPKPRNVGCNVFDSFLSKITYS